LATTDPDWVRGGQQCLKPAQSLDWLALENDVVLAIPLPEGMA
jgi:hypothetical protein